MAQALTEGTRSVSDSTGKIMNVVLWILQIAAAGIFMIAIVLLVVTGVVAWRRRQRTMNVLAGLR